MAYGIKKICDFSTDRVSYSDTYLIVVWVYSIAVNPIIIFII